MGGAVEDAFSWTPVGMIVDAAQGKPTAIEEAFNPPPKPPPPACSTYRSGTGELELRSFNPDQPTPGRNCSNELTNWLEEQRHNFCNNINNFTKNPGGGTCIERNAGQALAREYCGGTDKIKSSPACTREYLGNDIWVQLATAYCSTESGKSDPWCSCFNVMNDVCDVDPNAAGCPEKALSYDVLVEKTPEAFRTAWSGRAPCYGLVCQESEDGSKWIPENANQNCAAPIQICGQSVQAEGITESTIDATCYIGGKEVDEEGNVVGGGPADQLVSKLPPGVRSYVPLSFDDLTGDDPNKKIGVGASVASSFMSCAFIVIILLLVTSGGSNGPTRFRRR
jgi:hypothetical protein